MKLKKDNFIIIEAEDLKNEQEKSMLSAYLGLAVAFIYLLIPFDIIPDFPIIGWFDDAFLAIAAMLNFIEKQSAESNLVLSQIAKTFKWISIILLLIAVLLALLFGAVILNLFV